MKKLFFFITISLFFVAGLAQGAPGDWNLFLDASAVNRITCTGDSLWCGTNGGILLFDLTDSTFTQFYDGLQLKSNDVTAVTIDGNGSIWAAFAGEGIVRIDNADYDPSVTHYSENATLLLSDSVTCLVSVEEDVYYGSANGAAKFYDNLLHSLEPTLSDSLSGKRINDMIFDADENTLWIAYEDGVAGFDRGTFACILYPLGSSYSLCEHDGMIYCATEAGIQRYDGVSWTDYGSWFHVMPPVGVASGGGDIFVVTNERVYRHNGVYWQSVYAAPMKSMFFGLYRIGANHLKTIAVDGNGTPWIGGKVDDPLRGSYISTVIDGVWHNKAPELLSNNNVVALDTAPGGGVWASTKYGISYRSGDGDWISYTKMRMDVGHDDALSYFLNNLAILYDSRNIFWCNAMNYDLDMIDVGDPLDKSDDLWMHFSVDDGTTITSDRFLRAKEDPAGNRWFISDDDYQADGKWGINITNTSVSEWLEVNPLTHGSMASGSVFDIAFDDYGVYIAMRGYGVQYWRTGGFDWNTLVSQSGDFWISYLDQENLSTTHLNAIELGNDGSIWLATSGGLVKYKSGVVDSFKVKTGYGGEGLVGMVVLDLELDGYGNLWVATNQGLNRINTRGVIDRAYTTTTFWEKNFQFVYPSSVISPLPSHICMTLACDQEENYLWIGTDRGVARLDVTPQEEIQLPLSEVILYPNPLYYLRGDTSLKISQISGTVDIRVYNLEGELVHEANGVSDGEEAWDLLSINGFRIVSGIYLVKITGASKTEIRKVAVIR